MHRIGMCIHTHTYPWYVEIRDTDDTGVDLKSTKVPKDTAKY